MSETTNLKLFKHDNPSTNENQFDVNKALNQNWDKLDEFSGEVNDKVIEIEDNIEGQELDIGELQQKTEQIEENVLDIQQGQETQNTEIENLQTEVQELNEDIKANAIIEETEKSKSLCIDDANASRGKVNVFGNMEQEIREGYNIYDYLPRIKASQGGLTTTKDEKTGYITINGTPTSDYTTVTNELDITDLLEDGQTYTLWQEKHKDSNTYGVYMQVTETTPDNTNNFYFSRDENKTFVVNKANTYKINIQTGSITNTKTLSNYKNRYMLYKGTSNKEFELYGATPTFDNPSPIKCVGSNVNHFDISNIENGGYSNTVVGQPLTKNGDTNRVRLNNLIEVLANKKYTFNFETNKLLRYAVLEIDTNNIIKKITSITKATSTTFTTTSETKYLTFLFMYQESTRTITTEDLKDCLIKLEEGDKTSYSSYNCGSTEVIKQNKNLYTPIVTSGSKSGITYSTDEKGVVTLNGTATAQTDIYIIHLDYDNPIKNVASKKISLKAFNSSLTLYGRTSEGRYIQGTTNLTESETEIINSFIRIPANTVCENLKVYPQIEIGDLTEYIEPQEESYLLDIQQDMVSSEDDYFDLERKKEVHGWEKIIFDGTENITKALDNIYNYILIKKAKAILNNNTSHKSNKYKSVICTGSNDAFVIAATSDYAINLNSGDGMRLRIKDIRNLSANDFKASLAQQHESGEPTIVYYKLETPIELDLTDTQIQQLEKLNKLRFYEGVNNIMTLEDIALIQAQYSVNIQTKLNNINNQLLSLGGN